MSYANNHPPLPALLSGTPDDPAAVIAVQAGAPLNQQDLIDARHQHEARKRLNRNNPPLATDGEVIDSKRRKTLLEVDHFSPGGLVALTTAVNNLATTVNHPVNGLAALVANQNTEIARNINRSTVRTSTDSAVNVPNSAGQQAPAWFGTISLAELISLNIAPANGQGLDAILAFYGAPTANGHDRARKLATVKGLLGITI